MVYGKAQKGDDRICGNLANRMLDNKRGRENEKRGKDGTLEKGGYMRIVMNVATVQGEDVATRLTERSQYEG